MIEIKAVRDNDEIATVARLAREIWHEYYVPIIGQAQVDYMVPKFQSESAIAEHIGDGSLEYFLLASEGSDEGYFAIKRQPAEKRLFLSKLYVRKEMRGRGIARVALNFIDMMCKQDSLDVVWLTVNKQNPSVSTYEKLGFQNVADIVGDIGNGFVMDDYRMEKMVVRQCAKKG